MSFNKPTRSNFDQVQQIEITYQYEPRENPPFIKVNNLFFEEMSFFYLFE